MVDSITNRIKSKAVELGLAFCEIAPADTKFNKNELDAWLEKGYAASMNWLYDNVDKRANPSEMLPGAKSIIVVGLYYYQQKPERRGEIATYALGRDYHKVLGNKLKTLSKYIEEQGGECKSFVDTAPIMERPIAEIAGAGWIGKSSLLVNKSLGKYFFLGELFTTLELETGTPHVNRCGSCTKCVEVCLTGAIIADGIVDAKKCISYLTIENKDEIPLEYRERIGDKLYGCDICTDICPWNNKEIVTRELDFSPRIYPDLRDMLYWNDEDFTKHMAGSPIHRVKLQRWKRNIAVVLGNIGTKDDITALQHAADNDSSLVKEHAQWAIDKLNKVSSV